MSLWGTTTADSDKPKFLPVDSNAAGSTGAREHLIASKSGWALSPGLAASGNDNADAQPEILVCIKNLAEAMGNASIIGIDWTDGEVADTGTFDIVVTFDEAVDITSAARSANQTVTNKAFILLSRLGVSDMVEDNTVACMYFSGSGTNQITFRGTVQTNAAAGFLAFNGDGVGDSAAAGRTAIFFNGTADIEEEDGGSILGLMLEEGARDVPGDKLVLNSTAGASTNAGDEIHMEGVDFTIAGVTGTADITDVVMTGGDDDVNIALEGATDEHQGGRLVQDTAANVNDRFDVEDYTSDIAVYTQAGSSTGSASVLNGVTVTAA